MTSSTITDADETRTYAFIQAMFTLFRIAFRSDSKSNPVKQWHRTGTSRYTPGKSCRSSWPRGSWWTKFPVLTPKYLLPSQRIPVLTLTYSLPLRSYYLFTLYQSVTQNLSDMWRCTFLLSGFLAGARANVSGVNLTFPHSHPSELHDARKLSPYFRLPYHFRITGFLRLKL